MCVDGERRTVTVATDRDGDRIYSINLSTTKLLLTTVVAGLTIVVMTLGAVKILAKPIVDGWISEAIKEHRPEIKDWVGDVYVGATEMDLREQVRDEQLNAISLGMAEMRADIRELNAKIDSIRNYLLAERNRRGREP